MASPGQCLRDPATDARLRFLETAASTEGRFIEVELDGPPAGRPVRSIVHNEQLELITVMAGELATIVAGRQAVARTGETVVVPAATPHTVRAQTGQGVKLRVRFTPALRSDQLLERMYGGGDRYRPPPFVPAALRSLIESRGYRQELHYFWPGKITRAAAALLLPVAFAVGVCRRLPR